LILETFSKGKISP